jgi:hypothetical protein
MHGWQVALIIIIIGISQIMMAYLYLRPRAKKKPASSAYSRWRLLLTLGILITIMGLILALLPESLWWA